MKLVEVTFRPQEREIEVEFDCGSEFRSTTISGDQYDQVINTGKSSELTSAYDQIEKLIKFITLSSDCKWEVVKKRTDPVGVAIGHSAVAQGSMSVAIGHGSQVIGHSGRNQGKTMNLPVGTNKPIAKGALIGMNSLGQAVVLDEFDKEKT